jgi:glycosyltransferase involved in cell wall biosynthesis
VVEAMALGVIPVVTKYVGSEEFVELIDKSLIREFKPSDIAETLAWLLTNEKVTKEYSRLSREVIRDVLSFSSIMNSVNEFLEVCLR